MLTLLQISSFAPIFPLTFAYLHPALASYLSLAITTLLSVSMGYYGLCIYVLWLIPLPFFHPVTTSSHLSDGCQSVPYIHASVSFFHLPSPFMLSILPPLPSTSPCPQPPLLAITTLLSNVHGFFLFWYLIFEIYKMWKWLCSWTKHYSVKF